MTETTDVSGMRTGILRERVLVAFTLKHRGHDGKPGHPGDDCPRCNAERALDEIVRRTRA